MNPFHFFSHKRSMAQNLSNIAASQSSNAQKSVSASVLAPRYQEIFLPDAAIASFVPISDQGVESNNVGSYEWLVSAAGRNITLVDADINNAFGNPPVGTYKTFRVTNRGASTLTLVTGGGGQVATGIGTLTVLTGAIGRFKLSKLSATTTMWTLDKI
jgi:hypothetical protein